MVFVGRRLARNARPGRLAASLRRGSRPFLPHDEFRGLGVARDVSADARGARTLLRRGDPVLLEHARRGARGNRRSFFSRRARAAERRGVEPCAIWPRSLRRRIVAGLSAAAAQVPPFTETVVVTATAAPEEIQDWDPRSPWSRARRSRGTAWRTVQDALRSVPGVDVAQAGGPGAQTSVFLRGANSTHTLVLVDGVRVNSPFFPGYDFSLLSTENVERIEVVRGPFSALYGSESIGGVVQIFTRPARQALRTGFRRGGRRGSAQGSAFFSRGHGPVRRGSVTRTRGKTATAATTTGASAPARCGSRVASANGRVALEGSIADGELGFPAPVGAETPRQPLRLPRRAHRSCR